MPFVKVQTHDFDLSSEVQALRQGNSNVGAVVSFVGTVRDLNEGADVTVLELEHYPGMTEKALETLRQDAHNRWNLEGSLIIHRVGKLYPTDQIVLVVTSSQHREDAFLAAQFIMDSLKTNAPFWKKEYLPDGTERWVDSRASDAKAYQRWNL